MKIRRLKRSPWLMLLIAIMLVWTVTPAAAQAKKPNIVVIFADDVGIWNTAPITAA